MPFSSFFSSSSAPFACRAVLFARGPGRQNCRQLCPGCPQLLRTSLRLCQLARGTVPSGSPKASKQQHEKATFNYWVNRFVEILCLALCLFSLPLSHSFSPLFPSVASNSSHMFRHCQACGEVHFSNGSFAQIPLLHCLVFANMREERCVYFFFLVGFNLFILVLIIF